MAEPLKNSFGHEIPRYVAAMISSVDPTFPTDHFVDECLEGYGDLELMPRARRVSDVLATTLPDDRAAALRLVTDALDAEIDLGELTGMEGFRYLPLVFFVADHGLDHFELAMEAQYELTQKFTAEFSIRAYLEQHPTATLDRLRTWTNDPSEHVRRLVSEGTRPRLPWAPQLRAFVADPAPVIELLELLRDDDSEYVRRSVANNINDIAKDHPAVAVDIARRWWPDGDRNRRRLIKHALRTLIKRGNADALAVLGYGPNSPLVIQSATIEPDRLSIGDKVRIEVELANPTSAGMGALVDLRVHFVKANGSANPKVFKGAEIDVDPGGTATVRKTVSLKQHTTRTHHPGRHTVDVMINGVVHSIGSFELE